jgi:hypothetical protein
MFFPRIIWLALGLAIHWNVRAELIFIALNYLLVYMGSDFSENIPIAAAIGAALCILYLVCAAVLWQRRADAPLVARALPWLILPGFAFGNALLAMIGRLGFGVSQALVSRYIIFSILLPVSLLFLTPLLFAGPAQSPFLRMPRPACLASLALLKSNRILEIADPASPGHEQYGTIVNSRLLDSGSWTLAGNAALPGENRPADAVLLTFESHGGPVLVFALATSMGLPLSEVGNPDDADTYANSGWKADFDPVTLPAGDGTVKVWAYDAEHARAYRLKGAVLLHSAVALGGQPRNF